MLITIMLIPAVIGVIIYAWFYQIDRAGCGKKGMALRVGSGWSPLYQYCVTEYPDGGNPCTSSQECQGDCLVNLGETAGDAYCEYDDDTNCDAPNNKLAKSIECLQNESKCVFNCDIQ